MIAAVRVRGKPNLKPKIKDALKILGLHRNNNCGIYEDVKAIKGNLKKVSNFVTWGEIDKELFEDLKEEKGKKEAELPVIFRLSPPEKGWGGKKKPYKQGGALGYRGESIKDLIRGMM